MCVVQVTNNLNQLTRKGKESELEMDVIARSDVILTELVIAFEANLISRLEYQKSFRSLKSRANENQTAQSARERSSTNRARHKKP